MNHTENTVQKPLEDVQKPLLIEVNGRLAPLENIRVVKINGRTRVLVIGREYEFTLKSGCVPQPYEETTKVNSRNFHFPPDF